MTQTLNRVRVSTGIHPTTNVATGSVRISVDPGNTQRVQSVNYSTEVKKVSVDAGDAQRVQSISYLPATDLVVANAIDVEILNSANNSSVLTYDNTLQKFLVQNIPRLNGGTF